MQNINKLEYERGNFTARPGRTLRIVEETAIKNPTIFLIHGLGGRAAQWRSLIPLLRSQYHVIAPDLLGHGQSARPNPWFSNPYTFVEHSKDLQIIFDKFATEENIVIGHSYGGALAMNLAAQNQNRIQKLILISPMRCQPFDTIPKIFHLPAWVLQLLRPFLEDNFRNAAFVREDNPDLINTENVETRKNSLAIFKKMLIGRNTIPIMDLTTIQTPTVIITGKEDAIIPPNISNNFYKTLPSSKLISVEHAAHMLMLEKPETVYKLIKDFISFN